MPSQIRDATEDDASSLNSKLRAFNTAATGAAESVPLKLVAIEGDRTVGGILASTWGGWMYVAILFVEPDARARGVGKQLIGRAEAIARERRCIGSTLTSFSFQARAFYERLGYEVFGQIDDYPPGETLFFFKKHLTSAQVHAGERPAVP